MLQHYLLEEARAKIVGILRSPAQNSKYFTCASVKIAILAFEKSKITRDKNNMADLNKIIEDLSLTVVEAAELSKQLEENGSYSCSSSCSCSYICRR